MEDQAPQAQHLRKWVLQTWELLLVVEYLEVEGLDHLVDEVLVHP